MAIVNGLSEVCLRLALLVLVLKGEGRATP